MSIKDLMSLIGPYGPLVMQWLRTIWGQRLVAAFCGSVCALAHPPFGWLIGLLGYGILMHLCQGDLGPKPLRRAFMLGWIAGFFYFLFGCFWVAEAFLVDAQTYGWMAPIAVCLLPLSMGLYWGLVLLIFRHLGIEGPWRGVAFALVFSVLEVARGTLFSGFPWNPVGASWRAGGAMSQLASLIGVYGLGFVTLVIATGLSLWRPSMWFQGGLRTVLKTQAPVISALVLLVISLGFGHWRLSGAQVEPSSLRVRIVQPAIGQSAKWSSGAQDRVFIDYYTLSKSAPPLKDGRPPNLIIWPEGALPMSLEEMFSQQSWYAEAMGGLLRPGQTLLFGAYHSDYGDDNELIWRNSMITMRPMGQKIILDPVYSKFKLVPFGERLPFETLMTQLGVKSLVHVGDGFTPGPRTRVITVEGVGQVVPLICYEGLFPGLVSPFGDANEPRANFIINISNDAWFGLTTGPRQHLNLSSFRAIEEGLPLVRSTPTGISGIIDPFGRMIATTELKLGARGVRDHDVPRAIKPTLFSQSHNYFIVLEIIFFLILFYNQSFVKVFTLGKKQGRT